MGRLRELREAYDAAKQAYFDADLAFKESQSKYANTRDAELKAADAIRDYVWGASVEEISDDD